MLTHVCPVRWNTCTDCVWNTSTHFNLYCLHVFRLYVLRALLGDDGRILRRLGLPWSLNFLYILYLIVYFVYFWVVLTRPGAIRGDNIAPLLLSYVCIYSVQLFWLRSMQIIEYMAACGSLCALIEENSHSLGCSVALFLFYIFLFVCRVKCFASKDLWSEMVNLYFFKVVL